MLEMILVKSQLCGLYMHAFMKMDKAFSNKEISLNHWLP